jgi:class 3 adenylate cyclase
MPTYLAQIWSKPRARIAAIFLLVMLVSAAGLFFPKSGVTFADFLERQTFDIQMRLLRSYFADEIENDIVLIGQDELSEDLFTEPTALWHRHYADVLQALSRTSPQAVGVDIALPDRSYDNIIAGLDFSLLQSIFALKQRTVLVFAETVDEQGKPIRVHPTYARILGEEGLGIDQQLKDPDQVARRFSERELGEGVASFSGQILRGLKRPVGEGYIDYSIGGKLDYLPMQLVIEKFRAHDDTWLKKNFEGRIVLFGSVAKRSDRWTLPVKLAVWEDVEGALGLIQPGVLIHLQALRSQISGGLLTPVSGIWSAVFCLLAACAVLARFRVWLLVTGALVLPIVLLVASLAMIKSAHFLFPLASVVATLWLAFAVRGVVEAVESVAERIRLKRSFAGQVSPAVMDEILAGELMPDSHAQLLEVCVIFSDIRGFTTLSETMSAESVMALLQRYFDRMVKVVHRYDGTIDKFIGDGMMVLFGTPRALPDPCGSAVRCAMDMLRELKALNLELMQDGLPPLDIGIGVNFGKAVVGNVGSSERHNYSAIGDTVNVAARVESVTKEVGCKILITETVMNRLGGRCNLESFGERVLKGHSPVSLWGVRMAEQDNLSLDGGLK